MALTSQQLALKPIVCQDNTIGGATYYVDDSPLCLAQCRGDGNLGKFCSQKAGYGTDHPGTGRCKDHAGRVTGASSITSGRYTKVAGEKLNQLYAHYASDPDMLDLSPELLMLRSILGNFMEFYQDVNLADPDHHHVMGTIVGLIEKVSKQVERMERIDRDRTLTVAVAKLIMTKGMLVGQKYVEDQYIEAFLNEWEDEVLKPISTTTYTVLEE